MPMGPGKYDDEVTALREQLHAVGVVLIVAGGKKGHGFSVQAPPELTLQLPNVLRQVADQIEASLHH